MVGFVNFVRRSIVQRRVKSISVVIAHILIDAITSFSKTIVLIAPDLFFFDGTDDAFDISVVIRGIVSGVLASNAVFAEEVHEMFSAGLSAVVTA